MPRRLNDAFELTEQTAPATPGSGALRLYPKSDHKLYIKDSTGAETDLSAPTTRVLRAALDGGGATLTTGAKKVYITVPVACTITSWRIMADQSGSIVLDIWKDSLANFPPTVADTITAAAKPTLTTATNANSSTLTGWTTALAAGDVLEVNVDSVTSVTKIYLDIFVSG